MADFGPKGAVVIIDVAFDVPDGNIISQAILENLLHQQLFGDRFQLYVGSNNKVPTVWRNFASSEFHFFFLVSATFFSGMFFIDGVSLAYFLATSGSRAKRYRAWDFDLNGMVWGAVDSLDHSALDSNVKQVIKISCL